MAEPFSYVPVLRWKAAEQNAFAKLAIDVRKTTCPLIEVCPPGFPTDNCRAAKTSELLDRIAYSIVDFCRGYRLFIDLNHLDRNRPGLRCRDGRHPLRFLFDNFQDQQLLFPEHMPQTIPVTGFSRSPDYSRAAIEIARTN